MCLDTIAKEIRALIPKERIPPEGADLLFRHYAVLAQAKGVDVTESDIYYARVISFANLRHESPVEFHTFSSEEKRGYTDCAVAVRKVAKKRGFRSKLRQSFESDLFPFGPPKDLLETKQAFDLYKMMVSSSEKLVSRRQAVNTSFLTMNGVLLTTCGIVAKSNPMDNLGNLGIILLSMTGVIICITWYILIRSIRQLNAGKFEVINAIEKYLNAAIYTAEWKALGKSKSSRGYRSVTSIEIWVPRAFLVLYILGTISALYSVLQNQVQHWLVL